MLAGKIKLSPEETKRRDTLLKDLRPGLSLIFHTADYHEEEEAPPGYFQIGDIITLLSIVDIRNIPSHHNIWLVSSKYGLVEKRDYYLVAMTEIKDV